MTSKNLRGDETKAGPACEVGVASASRAGLRGCWSRSEASPEWRVDDLVEQVVVQGGGGRQAQELHGERGDEAERDAGGAEDDEDLQAEPVLQDRRTGQTQRRSDS